ncbi:peptidase [Serinibacter arcticus]|uniref:Peptidase n=1 Tax=Serinibacter arcticus TaxID=1655435 RepID=A0A2U1ZSZ9_9MICO|nr:sodium:proton antiporter [Serinibacter arcticus]PWD50115.1 peptidase [Serinibacter arcticus]
METIALLLVVGVLLVIGASWLAPRLSVAAPIVLVVVGIGCSYLPGVPEVEIEPELILAIVLPPILYSAAVNVPVTDFRRNLRAISGLSVLLVLLSTVVVGFVLHLLLPTLPLAAAFALGAVVSPPDAVAATSIGKRLGLPPRLVTMLEGEGLVNDATALVLLRSAIAAIGGGVSFGGIAGDFAFAVVVAIAIGLGVGLATVWVRARLGQPTLTTAISFVVPFLAFFPAEAVGASGVLSVVAAGLVTGYKSARHLSAQDRISERLNWRTIQLILENGVFLVMGFQLAALVDDVEHEHLSVLAAVGIGALVTLVLLAVRVVFVVPLIASLRREERGVVDRERELEERATAMRDRLEAAKDHPRYSSRRAEGFERRVEMLGADLRFVRDEGLGWRGGAVLAWSGMRGVVTLAAAQTLPHDVPLRPQLVLIAFTVALLTLVGYGTTLPLLIRRLGVRGPDADATTAELTELMATIVQAGADRLASPELVRADGSAFEPRILADLAANRRRLSDQLAANMAAQAVEQVTPSQEAYRIMLEAEQAALLDARASGSYSSHVLERAQTVLDADLARAAGGGSLA